jgi:hypothetical protein
MTHIVITVSQELSIGNKKAPVRDGRGSNKRMGEPLLTRSAQPHDHRKSFL